MKHDNAGPNRGQRGQGGYRRLRRPLALIAAAAVVLLLALPSTPLAAAPPEQTPDAGATLFRSKCTSCHTVGGGKLIGPDLQGVTSRRDAAWLQKWLAAPDRVLSQGDPTATQLLKEYGNVPMPNLGLSEQQIASLIAYLSTQTAGSGGNAGGTQPSAAAALPAGDAVAGKELFTGIVRLGRGGPPCMACHSVSGIGPLGGGALGPDLTTAYARLGDAGIASWLANTPSPTMQPVFGARPLSPQEQSDLKAFLAQTVATRPTRAIGNLAMLAAAGAAVGFLFIEAYWHRRLRGVRRPMLQAALAGAARVSSSSRRNAR